MVKKNSVVSLIKVITYILIHPARRAVKNELKNAKMRRKRREIILSEGNIRFEDPFPLHAIKQQLKNYLTHTQVVVLEISQPTTVWLHS